MIIIVNQRSTIVLTPLSGGQQGPILAAAGADVTVLDNSPRQLEGDIYHHQSNKAMREKMEIQTGEAKGRLVHHFLISQNLVFRNGSNAQS